jgi:ATP-binding cassette subfamily B protein
VIWRADSGLAQAKLSRREYARLIGAAIKLGLRGGRGPLIVIVLATVAAAVAPVLAAWLTGALVDGLAGGSAAAGLAQGPADGGRELAGLVAGLAATSLALSLLPFVNEYAEAEFGRRVGLIAQDDLYAALGGLKGLARFEDPRFHNRLAVAQASGGTIPGNIIGSGLRSVQSAITLAGFITTVAVLAGWVAIFLAVAAIPMLLAELRLARQHATMTYRVETVERRERFFTTLICDLRAAKEVRLFGLNPWLRERVRADRTEINAEQRGMDRRRITVQSVLKLLSAVIAVTGLVWVIAQATAGRLSPGDVMVFVAATASVQSSLAIIASSISMIRRHTLLFQHYREVLTCPADLTEPATPSQIGPLHTLELRDVWFRYGEDQPWVLRGLNLSVGKGQSLAVVGPNGAGKSTLIKLLCRFYDPVRGSIRWNGVDLRDYPVDELRARMSLLFQDFMQYDLTAHENIAIGDIGRLPERESVVAAAIQARIHDRVSALPRGYDTMLSRAYLGGAMNDAEPDDGVILSGGQWQRIALARALLRQPRDLMVLDEPSSGLDPQAEQELYRDLRAGAGDQTSIVVTHRAGAISHTSLVAVMNNGVVTEFGDHATLRAADGWYARMFGDQVQLV